MMSHLQRSNIPKNRIIGFTPYAGRYRAFSTIKHNSARNLPPLKKEMPPQNGGIYHYSVIY